MKNREIRFRIWNGSKMENRIMAGFLGAFYVQGIDEKDSASMSPFNTKYHDETPLMQFTGLHDKNNKPIYEGDIVKFIHPLTIPIKNWTAQIVYDTQTASFGIIGGNTNIKGVIEPFSDYDEPEIDLMPFIEIIGNLYETPELLNTK